MKIIPIGHLVKTNPNKANFRKDQMNVNSLIAKDYRKKDDFAVRKNKPNLVRRRRIANERNLFNNSGL